MFKMSEILIKFDSGHLETQRVNRMMTGLTQVSSLFSLQNIYPI
jgi:hypothetical protein